MGPKVTAAQTAEFNSSVGSAVPGLNRSCRACRRGRERLESALNTQARDLNTKARAGGEIRLRVNHARGGGGEAAMN